MNRRESVTLGLAAALTLGAASAPAPIGQYGRWGAFRARDGRSCYAISEPTRAGRPSGAFLTVSTWPERGVVRTVRVRFRGAAEAAVLTLGGKRFPLTVERADGWPAAADERQIVRAMREGGGMRVTARIGGRRTTDSYALEGAASAIDAADLACLRAVRPGRQT